MISSSNRQVALAIWLDELALLHLTSHGTDKYALWYAYFGTDAMVQDLSL